MESDTSASSAGRKFRADLVTLFLAAEPLSGANMCLNKTFPGSRCASSN